MADSSMDTTRRLELRAISRMRSTSALACIAIVVGVVLIIEAYANARHDIGSRHFTIFWCGYLLAMLAVLAFNIIHSSRKISAGCMIAVGLITYLPKFLMSI